MTVVHFLVSVSLASPNNKYNYGHPSSQIVQKQKKKRKFLSFYEFLYIRVNLCRQLTAVEEKHCVEVKRTKAGASHFCT